MTTEIQLLDADKIKADIFFDREPIATDWDKIRSDVVAGIITKASALEKLKSYELLAEADLREHQHWVDQQCLRLALFHAAKKPLEVDFICPRCGVRKMDAYFGSRSYHQSCLPCQEYARQEPDYGSRGSCEFVEPAFNPRSHAWGILYYWDMDQGSTGVLFWLADFFRSRREAEQALWPIHYYDKWLDRKYNSLMSYHREITRLLPISVVMQLKLPMNPLELREHLRNVIQADMDKEHEMMGYVVDRAMDDHERAERD